MAKIRIWENKKEGGMSLQNRMIRAAKLDVTLYEEVEADEGAIGQAMLVVILSSLAGGIGAGLSGISGQGSWLGFLIIGSIAALIGWFIWALLTFLIGTTVFKGPKTSAKLGELLRTIGFSASPGVLRILVFIPVIGPIISLVAMIWMLVAMVIAVRQALDFSTARAVGTCVVGFIIQIILLGLGGMLFSQA
jgi:hypothetical protein